MRIRILAFATAAAALGSSERELELPEGATVEELIRTLARELPELAARQPRWALAVDGELAAGDRVLADGSEVALLPPVSGG